MEAWLKCDPAHFTAMDFILPLKLKVDGQSVYKLLCVRYVFEMVCFQF